jgi:heat shock protein HslJ
MTALTLPSRRCFRQPLILVVIAAAGCTGAPVQENREPGTEPEIGGTTGTPWEQARLRGVEFRAIGQEPGWNLEIDQGREIRYVGDYGDTNITVPAPDADVDSAGAIVYHATNNAHELHIVIRPTACQDVMSGEAFTHSVSLTVDGRELQGCGRVLSTGELTNTHWRLVSLDGAPALGGTPQREPFLRLTERDHRLAGSTGCNLMFGEYALDGERIRFSAIGSTRMACTDPALAQQEQSYVRMLEAVDSVSVVRDTLTLFAGKQARARFEALLPM